MVVEAPEPEWYLEHLLAYSGAPARLIPRQAAAWQQWWREQASADRVARVAAEQGFVLRSADLAALGVTRARARTAVRRGRWWTPAVGVVAPLELSDGEHFLQARRRHAVTATAAALRRPLHVVSGRSAAVLHGLPTVRVPEMPELTAATPNGLGHHSVAHTYGACLTPQETAPWFGVTTTDVARTVVDVARHDRRDGLLCADAALREGLTNPAALARSVRRSRGWPGARTAREVVALADPRSDSPLESLTRLALRDDGFPTPELQRRIGRYWVDFCWPEFMLVLEADGRVKYTGDERWGEKTRETALRRLGWTVERVLWSDVFAGWSAFAAGFRRYF